MPLPNWLRSTTQMNFTRRALTIADMRMENVAKWAARAALAVVACAFAISFAAIKWVAEENGIEPRWLAWFFPLVIDLPSLIASALTVALHDRKFHIRLYAWSVLAVFIALSWACNAVHALSIMAKGENGFVKLLADLLNIPTNSAFLLGLVLLFALIPPVGVVLGVHLWAYALRNSAAADQRADGKTTKQQTQTKQQTKTDPGTERSGKTDPGKQQTAPGKTATTTFTTAANAPGTAPATEGNGSIGRHSAPADHAENAPESAPETAPATETKRSGPKRSAGHPARTLIDFEWERSDEEITSKPGNDWKVAAREIIRAAWQIDPDSINAADVSRELGDPVVPGTMRKWIAASIKELTAWPLYTETGAEVPTDRAALRAELHAADPNPDEDLDTRTADDKRAVNVA